MLLCIANILRTYDYQVDSKRPLRGRVHRRGEFLDKYVLFIPNYLRL